MNIFISSLNFSPGHYSHMVALYKIIEELGHNPLLYINKKYIDFLEEEENDLNFIKWGDSIIDQFEPHAIFFQNNSTKNYSIAKKMKKKFDTNILYIYHEPWDGFLNYINKEKNVKSIIKLLGAHYFSKKLIKICDGILLPSKYAIKNYKKYEIKYNPNYHKLPLLFTDETHGYDENKISHKEFFSYIGTATASHAFEEYIGFIYYCLERELPIKFQIVTKTNISRYIDNNIKKAEKKGKILLKHGKILTNEEINHAYSKSFCLWNLYNRSTQSGVLAKSFMFGTPVIATPEGSFKEFIKNRNNGIIINNNKNYDDIFEGVNQIEDNLEKYANNCREFFLNNFHYKPNKKTIKKLL